MEKFSDMELYTLEECLDEHFGPVGTDHRDAFEAKIAESLHAYYMGENIRQARLSKYITQQQLEVKRSHVSRIENADNFSFTTLGRIFRALKVPASIDLAGEGKVSLWQ